jgi:hypothetical protein
MSLSIVVNGGGTFTASMEEGPVSFTASLAAVGPAGPGVAVGGTTGQVLAKASGTNYDTEWVARNPFNQELNTTDIVRFDGLDLGLGFEGYLREGELSLTTGMFIDSGITFPDQTQQFTALPSGLADGNIVSWDADTSTYLSVPNDARTLFITARNITGTTIPKGSVVLITGASGNRPTIGLAQGNTSSNADGVIGITAAAINNNANGRVITEGLASNLDTSAFAAGDKLYLSATTPGGLVNVRPVQPAHSVAVGVVTRSNPAVGSIEVRVQVGEHLEFLHDVLLTSNTNLDLLSYETSSGLWKNKSFSTLGLLTSATAASTYLTTSTAASTYAPIASPTFTGTVTIPAGASISGFASLASPVFTGVPEAPTAAATTNTTQVATTAFVQQEVPAASTTAAGKVELATDAEAVAGTSATLAVTPSGLLYASARPSLVPLRSSNSASATSGSGSGTDAGHFGMYVISGSTSGGYGVRRFTVAASGPNSTVGSSYGVINYNKPIRLTGKLQSGGPNNVTHANATVRYIFGKSGSAVAGDLAGRGFGIKFAQGSALVLTVHDGTNLTDVTSSYTPSANEFFMVEVHSDGAGNVTAYVNGSSVATSSAGPTGNSAQYAGPVHFEIENTGTPSGSPGAAWNGGWLFMND